MTVLLTPPKKKQENRCEWHEKREAGKMMASSGVWPWSAQKSSIRDFEYRSNSLEENYSTARSSLKTENPRVTKNVEGCCDKARVTQAARPVEPGVREGRTERA